MNDEEAAFVEAMGQFLGSSGMTPMAGRLWGYLLICDPPEQTAAQIAAELHASRGAISGTVRLLEAAGFVRRTRRRGDRREYFSAPPGTFMTFAANAGAIYRRLRLIIEQGLAALDGKPAPIRARLHEADIVIRYIERVIPAALERFVEEAADTRAAAAG
ncbi:MAG TPA: MarR family transcriptional regulator [Candidatus Limnocylindrales bacterium]